MPDGDERSAPDRFRGRRDPHVPPGDVVGRPTGEVADLYRADGFRVQILDLDRNPVMTLEYSPDRIRLVVRDGRVVRASQG